MKLNDRREAVKGNSGARLRFVLSRPGKVNGTIVVSPQVTDGRQVQLQQLPQMLACDHHHLPNRFSQANGQLWSKQKLNRASEGAINAHTTTLPTRINLLSPSGVGQIAANFLNPGNAPNCNCVEIAIYSPIRCLPPGALSQKTRFTLKWAAIDLFAAKEAAPTKSKTTTDCLIIDRPMRNCIAIIIINYSISRVMMCKGQ